MEDNILKINYEDKEITLIGTSHVLQESAELVKRTIDAVCPDTVCIELDEERYKNLQNPEAWENTNVAEIIKSKRVWLLLANIVLSNYQKQVAKKLNTTPSQEMLQGIRSAKEHHCAVVLADRDIQITFLRIWRNLSFWEKCKLFVGLLFNSKDDPSDEEIDITDLMKKDNLESAISSMGEDFPQIAEILIHERDQHMAYKIKTAKGKKIVAVIGAAHADGIGKEIYCEQNLENITSVPKSSGISRTIAWGIPIGILLVVGYGFFTNFQLGLQQLTSWFLWNSVLAALFTAVVFGHPLSILTAFVAAPITSLNPFLACGWFAGLVEATIRKPTVEDVNHVPDDIFHIGQLFKNRFLRALAIVIFANIGSSIGTLIAGTDIIRSLF